MEQAHTCNTNSDRAKKARFAVLLDNKLLRFGLLGLLVCASVLWILQSFVSSSPLAHLWALCISVLTVPLGWYYGELANLDSQNNKTQDIDSRLDRKVLGRLSSNTSTEALVKIIFNLGGGRFFASRFLIQQQVVMDTLSDNKIPIATVWQNAAKICEELGFDEISDAAVAAALVLSMPDRDAYLAGLQLDKEDIYAGVGWYAHLSKTIEYHVRKRETGGIGRDLSFGWAPLLNRVGHNFTDEIQRYGLGRRTPESRDEVVRQMVHVLSQPGRRNAALIGEVGVGKTTIVYALADKLLEQPKTVPESLRFRQVIELDAAHIVSQAQGPGQIEQLMIRLFNEAQQVKNVIFFFDNAELFFKDGTGSVDLSSVLLPILQGGSLQMIFSLTDQQWLKINQSYPELAQLLNRVIVKPTDEVETMQVMQDEVLLLESKHQVLYTYRSLQEAYRLAERYIRDQAFPGRGIKLLEAATGFPEQNHFMTSQSVAEAVERSYDVKVQVVNTAAEKDTLLNLEEKIHERMINQSRAVKLVSDALRRARTGVRSEGKPIGTFLFLGPTGVGKTELSKSLADAYFGGEDRLVRIDMNEYSQGSDTSRLLAVAAEDPYSLSAQISKQPFSVVLLDEIEKAHPNVLNLLLQMLDEGVLRDNENKPVSFRDAIVIATSNAGADKIRSHIDSGELLEDFEEQFTNELIDAQLFKPEFLNRFDEIIVFRPLTPDELLQVVDLMINGLNKRLAAQKVSVELTVEAKKLLIDNGYDPRLGARPLRRTVQRAVENLVAQRMLGNEVTPGEILHCDAPELQQILADRR